VLRKDKDLHQTMARYATVRARLDTAAAADKRSCLQVDPGPRTASPQGRSAGLDLVDAHTALCACVCLGLHMSLNSVAKALSTI